MNLNVIVAEPRGETRSTPIIFVHGAWHAAWCWTEHFTEFFADSGYRSYAIDLRGHGDSDGNVKTARIAHYVHDVRRLALGLDNPPITVGHSMGGLVVQQYLSQYRATAGVLMAPVPSRGALGATMRVVRRHPLAFLKANATLSLWPLVEDPDRAISLLFGPNMDHRTALAHATRLEDESYLAYLEMILDLPRTSCVQDPVLILGAQLDTLFSPSEIEATARAYGTEAIIFNTMAHDMMLEPGWETVADVILGWIGSGVAV